MSQRVCSLPDCARPHDARGLCQMHYNRWARHGDPETLLVRLDLATRLWGKVTKTETCWVWTGRTHEDGYGRLWANGRDRLAHRVSWVLARGAIPGDLYVLHKCDNPPCVRPSHLFLGTQADNIADMDRKGRRNPTRGEANPSAKLSRKDAMDIRRAHKLGESVASLSRRYPVNQTTVRRIVEGLLWRGK